jgi:predicted transcriptional regulator
VNQKHLTLRDVIETLDLTVLVGDEFLSSPVEHVLASDLMSDVLAFSKPRFLLVTGLSNIQSVVTANISEAVCVLYTMGKRPDESTQDRATAFEIPLLASEEDTYSICCQLHDLGFSCKSSRTGK